MTSKTTTPPAAKGALRADYRMQRLITHLEGLLTSKDKVERILATKTLARVLVSQAELKGAREERQLRREELAFKTGRPITTAAVADMDAIIEQLKKERAAENPFEGFS